MKIRSFVDKTETTQVDLTPLIDVVFILLIFFILSANFTDESSIRVDRPSASSANMTKENITFNISIDENGDIWFDHKVTTLSQLQLQLKSRILLSESSNAVVNADKSIETGKLIAVIDVIRNSGVKSVAIATQNP